jgi:hypothetical protein
MVRDSEHATQEIESRSQMAHLDTCHRYPATRGLGGSASTTNPKSGEILAHTGVRLAGIAVARNLDSCVELLKNRDGAASLGRLSEFSAAVLSTTF